MMPDMHCPTCGRYGTADDGCEIGGECPADDCCGTIALIQWDWDDVIDDIDHMLGTHQDFDNLCKALKVAQAAVFYARDNDVKLEVT